MIIFRLFIAFSFCWMIIPSTNAQDDLLGMLEDEASEEDAPVFATFKTMKIVNTQTNEMVKHKTLDFRITHRFGSIGKKSSGGVHTLYGFDNSEDIRMSFDVGLTNNLQIGFGRSKRQENLDFSFKYRILEQSTKKKPLSIVWFSNMIITPKTDIDNRYSSVSRRISYVHQAILARKFSDRFSLLLNPTIVYRNLVEKDIYGVTDENLLYSLGIGARIKINQRVALIGDYFLTISDYRSNHPVLNYYAPFGLGVEIETGGHVFHITLTNAAGIIEQNLLTTTTDSWKDFGFKLGFNISRVFNLWE